MTQPVYTPQALASRKLPSLKQIAVDLGVAPGGNKTKRQTWIDAIIAHQSAQLQRIARPAPDEQDIAQGKFDGYIANQAQAVAPEELTVIEINPHHFEIFAGKRVNEKRCGRLVSGDFTLT
ncbi:MAG: hypothetical protein KAF91_23215 [Nostoc sp. TH1S01]|nr:hypothetical protein [Nostoc sp. TH1S01]